MNTNTPEVKKPTGQSQGSQMRITQEEQDMIKRAFGNNEPLIRLMRKIFLPELDPKAPIGQMIDLWMTVDVKDMSPEDALVNIKARNTLITHVDQQLMTLLLISKQETPTEGEVKAKITKDSTK